MGGLTAPGAVQQVLKGGGHIEVLIYWEGHAVVQVLEKVVRPLEDGANWVVHGNLKGEKQGSEGGWTPAGVSRSRRADLVQGLAAEHRQPVCGLGHQSRQQGAAGEEDRRRAAGEVVHGVRHREPVQDGGRDVCGKKIIIIEKISKNISALFPFFP